MSLRPPLLLYVQIAGLPMCLTTSAIKFQPDSSGKLVFSKDGSSVRGGSMGTHHPAALLTRRPSDPGQPEYLSMLHGGRGGAGGGRPSGSGPRAGLESRQQSIPTQRHTDNSGVHQRQPLPGSTAASRMMLVPPSRGAAGYSSLLLPLPASSQHELMGQGQLHMPLPHNWAPPHEPDVGGLYVGGGRRTLYDTHGGPQSDPVICLLPSIHSHKLASSSEPTAAAAAGGGRSATATVHAAPMSPHRSQPGQQQQPDSLIPGVLGYRFESHMQAAKGVHGQGTAERSSAPVGPLSSALATTALKGAEERYPRRQTSLTQIQAPVGATQQPRFARARKQSVGSVDVAGTGLQPAPPTVPYPQYPTHSTHSAVSVEVAALNDLELQMQVGSPVSPVTQGGRKGHRHSLA